MCTSQLLRLLITFTVLNLALAMNTVQAQSNDTDYDGLDDTWELLYFADLIYSGTDDPDVDWCNNGCEETRSLDPTNPDTDGDGLKDGEEVYGMTTSTGTYYSNPLVVDSDGDGISDYTEIHGTPPTNPSPPDSDGDGLLDAWEMNFFYNLDQFGVDDPDGDLCDNTCEQYHGTNPLLVDTDADVLTDYDEVISYGTDPLNRDTDADGLLDGEEVNGMATSIGTFTSNPLRVDSDGDGISDYNEIHSNPPTNPWPPDSDKDGLLDEWEMTYFQNMFQMGTGDPDSDLCNNACEQTHSTNPLSGDSDSDGLSDFAEIYTYATDPLDADTDADGLSDGDEVQTHHTYPLIADTDADGITDGDEVNTYLTSPTLADSDNDTTPNNLGNSLSDYDELFTYFTNPLDADTDQDGFSDYDELFVYDTDPAQINLAIPIPLSPADGDISTNARPVLTWNAVGDIADYEIKLDIVDPPHATYIGLNLGTSFTPPSTLYAGTYYWQVRSVGTNGAMSPWSDVQTLIVRSTESAAPTRNVLSDAHPILTWNPITLATSYQVEIAGDSNFTVMVRRSDTLPSNATSYVSPEEWPNGIWYWRVRARKPDNITWGEWSPTETVQVIVAP